MCVLSIIPQLLTTAISTIQTITGDSAQRKIAAYQMEENRQKAKKAEMEAAYERQNGVEEARRQKLNSILNMGNEKAKLAGANIAMSSGTVLNLADDLKLNSELESLTTLNQAERKAQDLMDKRNSLYADSSQIRFNSKLKTLNSRYQLGNSSIGLLTNTVGNKTAMNDLSTWYDNSALKSTVTTTLGKTSTLFNNIKSRKGR